MAEFIIDPPSPFAPMDEWLEYLAALMRIDGGSESVSLAIKEARDFVGK